MIEPINDIQKELEKRDRRRRYESFLLTPEQRFEKMMRLQRAARERLRASPAGYAHFIRRNMKKRAISVINDG